MVIPVNLVQAGLKGGLLTLMLGQIAQVSQMLHSLLVSAGRFLFRQVNDFLPKLSLAGSQ